MGIRAWWTRIEITSALYSAKRAYRRFTWLNSIEAKSILLRELELVEQISNVKKEVKSNLVLICMCRDERELLDFWINHHASFQNVRRLIIIDHLSKQPVSLKKLSLGNQVEVQIFRFNYPSYLQAHVVNHVANLAARELNNVFILPLDADEFLSEATIENLVAVKSEFGCLEWRLAWPKNLYSFGPEVAHWSQNLLVSKERFAGEKHFVHARKILRGYKWSQGAHRVYNFWGFPKKLNVLGELIHVPVRSYEQIREKFSLGESVHQHKLLDSLDSTGKRVTGGHWTLEGTESLSKIQFIHEALSRYSRGKVPESTSTTWNDLMKACL